MRGVAPPVITAHYPGTCARCRREFPVNTAVMRDESRSWVHLKCPERHDGIATAGEARRVIESLAGQIHRRSSPALASDIPDWYRPAEHDR